MTGKAKGDFVGRLFSDLHMQLGQRAVEESLIFCCHGPLERDNPFSGRFAQLDEAPKWASFLYLPLSRSGLSVDHIVGFFEPIDADQGWLSSAGSPSPPLLKIR